MIWQSNVFWNAVWQIPIKGQNGATMWRAFLCTNDGGNIFLSRHTVYLLWCLFREASLKRYAHTNTSNTRSLFLWGMVFINTTYASRLLRDLRIEVWMVILYNCPGFTINITSKTSCECVVFLDRFCRITVLSFVTLSFVYHLLGKYVQTYMQGRS